MLSSLIWETHAKRKEPVIFRPRSCTIVATLLLGTLLVSFSTHTAHARVMRQMRRTLSRSPLIIQRLRDSLTDHHLQNDHNPTPTPPLEPDLAQQRDALLALMALSIENGQLTGSGTGRPADRRLHAFTKRLLAATHQLTAGRPQNAVTQLQNVLRFADGQSRPRDFVAGPALTEITQRVQSLVDTILLTLTIDIVGQGTVDVDPDRLSYDQGEQVQLTANPAPGYRFIGFSGDLQTTTNPATLTTDADVYVVATFEQIPRYTLSVELIGQGSLTADPNRTSYLQGTQVDLTATPEPGYRFIGFSGDLQTATNPATITMDADANVIATFEQIPRYTLSVETIGQGSVTVDPDQATYLEGAQVQLTATPEPGYRFIGFSGDLQTTTNPATITIDADANVIATFEQIPRYTLSVETIGLGSATVEPDQATYLEGTQVQLTATPAPGWRFISFSGDLQTTTNPATVTINTDANVIATFEAFDPAGLFDIWYGDYQTFGALGIPQPWVNILGNLREPDTVASLTYALNGGPQVALSIGPAQNIRLSHPGDFNAEIAYDDLDPGINQLVLTATTLDSEVVAHTVTVDYIPNNVWLLPYSVDWTNVNQIQNAAQIVDGLWALTADGVKTVLMGYDRSIVFGDQLWQDYEVTTQLRVDTIKNRNGIPLGGPAVGLLLRWQGHVDWNLPDRPRIGWYPTGAIGWFSWGSSLDSGSYQIVGSGGLIDVVDDSGLIAQIGTTYIWKMRVETLPGNQGSLYSFKTWPTSQDEPAQWLMTYQSPATSPPTGAVMLFVHNAQVTFSHCRADPLP